MSEYTRNKATACCLDECMQASLLGLDGPVDLIGTHAEAKQQSSFSITSLKMPRIGSTCVQQVVALDLPTDAVNVAFHAKCGAPEVNSIVDRMKGP